MGWIRKGIVLLGAAGAGCAPSLTREIIKNHPEISLAVFQPQVVERSAPLEPAWVRKVERGAAEWVPFTGQSFAPTLDAAKAQAYRDLLTAVSNFVSVEVEAEFEMQESAKTGEGESVDARSTVKARTGADLKGIAPSETYWEKVVASPLTPENVSYRAYVYAAVPKSEIARARLRKQRERQKTSGKKMVVVLPFRPALAGAPEARALANAFADELGRRLADAPTLHVGDAALVQSVVSGDAGKSESDAIQALSDVLLPDLVVGGSYQLADGRLKVTYSIYEGTGGKVLHSRSLVRPYLQLFELQEELVSAIKSDVAAEEHGEAPAEGRPALGAAAPPARAADEARTAQLKAFEAYHAAFELFGAGKNDAAMAKLEEALRLRPDYALAHLRFGRVLERMGRYGRVPAAHRVESPLSAWDIKVCTEWSKISTESREVFLGAAEGARAAGGGPSSWGAERAANVDHVLSAVTYALDGGPMPDPRLPKLPRSAIGEYWSAYRIAAAAGEARIEAEALLALADLAVRVDRLAGAERIYDAIYRRAERTNDLHLMSLSRYGLGAVRRNQGRYEEALKLLEEALVHRAVLGEKPYLLEIYNELGGVEVEMNRYPAAVAHFEKARRIAEDLDQAYFRAVLSNNLGVIEYLRGRVSIAEQYFDEAWDYLSQIGEAEGQVSAGLNVGYLGSYKGDLERAKQFLEETRRIIAETSQEGRMALHHNHQGFSSLVGGKRIPALRSLLKSWGLFHRLGRTVQDLRLRNNVAAAEYLEAIDSGTVSQATLQCLAESYAELLEKGYGVYLRGWDPEHPDELDYAYEVDPASTPGGAAGVGALVPRLNAEVIRRLRR